MAVGDNIRKAAENAMEDLAGVSQPTDDGNVPEPGTRDDDVQSYSSISEGSNAAHDAAPEAAAKSPGVAGGTRRSGSDDARVRESASEENDDGTGTREVREPRDVPGPAGLPEPDPAQLRADPSEAGEDPSSTPGRVGPEE
ncbi:hypothetical protein [Arthrobacter bambusae]|uniref:hypothetical protein n=1 Tax=Arthrobacter bambusae TaxID=1338426 RepID=UPI0027822CE2|nr:hypothetical protein [Arthrobacter bambusae]MDQ0028589.1 hypothetical protein [Arthrobacter bambusae]MDQ0096617.1 hypothetical protein [Arthrobacter bambusae]